MGTHEMLARLQAGEGVPLEEFYRKLDPISQLIVREGGLFPFSKAFERGEIELPKAATRERPMTMGEKILARHLRGGGQAPSPVEFVKAGHAVGAEADRRHTHEFTTAQVHCFLGGEYGTNYRIGNPKKF